jgi:hypothetical protein
VLHQSFSCSTGCVYQGSRGTDFVHLLPSNQTVHTNEGKGSSTRTTTRTSTIEEGAASDLNSCNCLLPFSKNLSIANNFHPRFHKSHFILHAGFQSVSARFVKAASASILLEYPENQGLDRASAHPGFYDSVELLTKPQPPVLRKQIKAVQFGNQGRIAVFVAWGSKTRPSHHKILIH